MFTFIGEWEQESSVGCLGSNKKEGSYADDVLYQGVCCLRARVFRCVDGIDMNLFEKALSLRRKFEQEQGLNEG